MIITKEQISRSRKGNIESDQRVNSITEPTTELTIKPITEKKAERIFSSPKNDFEKFYKNSDVVPKEKNCGKKEKVILPYESIQFEKTWSSWKQYSEEKYQKTYSIIEEQAALMPLQNYDEDFSIHLILKAISSGWKSFHFADTPNQFQTHLIKKSKNYEQSGREFRTNEFKNAVNERSEELWGNFA